MKERFLTVLVPVKDSDVTQTYQTLSALLANVTPSIDNINNIYAVGAPVYGYMRTWLNPATNQYEFHQVVDREFPYLGKPLEIFDFTYDATRMGSAPTITAQGIMWYADKDSSGNDVTLEGLWSQECHVSFNGENFYLKQIPTSSKSNEDARYKYDIDFVSERVILERVYLYDVVQPFVSSKPISESAQFSFYGDITELAKRINASLLKSGLASIELKEGVTQGSFLTYEEFNSVGLETYTGDKDTSDPYPEISGEGGHEVHDNIYEHFGGNYTKYLLNRVYQVDNPQTIHIGPVGGGYDEIYDGDFRMHGYKCLIGKNEKGVLTTSDEKLITFENNYIHEALQEFHDTFELQYYIYREKESNGNFTGNTIIMVADCQYDFADINGSGTDYVRGSDGIPVSSHPFDYGVSDALLAKEKTNTTEKIVTRITGTGSESNIPWYYPNPNPDGWIKPLYRRRGNNFPARSIDYPKSEGESVRYEKFLKNRVGNKIKWGRIHDIVLKFDPDSLGNEYDEEEGLPYYYASYVFVNEPSDYFKFTLKYNFPETYKSNLNHFTIKLFRGAERNPLEVYDSSETYANPTVFQSACISGDGSVEVPLIDSQERIYRIAIRAYLLQIPLSEHFDQEGYYYPKFLVTYEKRNETGSSINEWLGSGFLPEDFYSESGLEPYTLWMEYGEPSHSTRHGKDCTTHHMRLYKAGRSVVGSIEYGAKEPLPRIVGDQYRDKSSGHIFKCNSPYTPVWSDNNPMGLYLEAFVVDPVMQPKEWFDRFINFELRSYVAEDWYLDGKKVNLADYGIRNEKTASYEKLLAEPKDWSVGYTSYYKLENGEYVQVTGQLPPAFVPGMYYLKHLSIDYGSGSSYLPTIFDTIEFQRVKYVTPQQRLMPEVYIKTDGERRFYDAHNYYINGGLRPGTADKVIGEIQEGLYVANNIYKENETDHDDKHYVFENEFMQSVPHEHIEVFDDIKPTITEQINYAKAYPTSADFSADPTSFYTLNNDGDYVKCTSSSIYSSETQYYVPFRIDIVEEFAFDELDNNDIWESNDNGNVSGEYKHPFFFAKLRPLGFNIFDLALQEDMILSMTTGHCGACNFRIGVDENTKKNPVQIWEYDVYGGPTYASKGNKIYSAGELMRVVDTSSLYYDTGGAEGYIPVNSSGSVTEGFLVDSADDRGNGSAQYTRSTYSGEQVANGEVGSLKQTPKDRFEGDVVVSGKFIDVQQDTSENYVWVALYKDTETYGIIMPSAQPDYGDDNYSHYIDPKGHRYTDRKTGVTEYLSDDDADKFVLLNIRLPQIYLRRAERKLSRKIVAYMYDNNYQKFNFSIKFSRIFLAENEDIEKNLNENSVLYVIFNNRIYRQYAKHYTYKMSHEEPLPEISVDLNEELAVLRTAVQRQELEQNRATQSKLFELRKGLADEINKISKKAISRNDDVVLSGNLVSLETKKSMTDINNDNTQTNNKLQVTRKDLATNHFRKQEFQVLNGTDLSIGGEVLLPTAFQRGQRMIKRKWDVSKQEFVEDAEQTFAPAFIDNTNKRFVQTGYVHVGGNNAPAFAQDTYYMFEDGSYILLTEQPSDWATAWTSYYKEGVSLDLTPARVNATYRRIVWGNDPDDEIIPIEIAESEFAVNTPDSEGLGKASDISIIRHTVEKRFVDNNMSVESETCGGIPGKPVEHIATVTVDNVKYLFWTDKEGNNVKYQMGPGRCQHDPFEV